MNQPRGHDGNLLQHPVEQLARRAADAPALFGPGIELTTGELDALVDRFATGLAGRGVGRGDVVAALLPNRIELVVTMFAAWRLGAALTPVNPALTTDEIRYQLADAAVAVVVADGSTAAAADEATGALAGSTPVVDVAALAVATGAAPASSARFDDVALVIYTSGTTGRPKGVLLDHANVAAMTDSIIAALELTADDRALLVLPLFHVNAILVSVMAPLLAGGSTVVLAGFERAAFWAAVETARPTYFSAVPAIYLLLEADGATDRRIDSVRFAICGAAPMPAAAIGAFERRFGIPVIEGYGLTESTVGATLNPLHGERRPGTVGVPLPGVEIGIVDDDGVALPDGAVGEVVIRGANVMRGYLGRPDESAATVVDGWLRTGDVGVIDRGYLRLVDRKKDLIIRGGENIYPKEVEQVLYAHPDVFEAAVVGCPDPVMGEEPVAIVALRPGATVTSDELAAHLAEHLARYKRPRFIELDAAIPKNSIGKIDKPALRARYANSPEPGRPD